MARSNKEVDVSRPASVFVRPLTGEEAVKLRRISRQAKVFALRQRAQIVLASDAQSAASEIARVLQTEENQVRRVIRDFNEMGMDFLRPRSGGGRPRRIDHESRERIRAVALARPQDLGEPLTRWSLTTLRRYLVREEIVDVVSKEHLRRILKSFHITAQRTRTWKKSNDPHHEQKKSWVLSAYRGAEAGTLDGVVVCFDECGPISLKPHAGQGWFQEGRPARQRATYRRLGGVRKLLGAYDVGGDWLWGKLEARPVTGAVVLEFFKGHQKPLPQGHDRLHRHGQPVGPLDPRHPQMGGRKQRRAHPHSDQRQPLEPDRVPLLGIRRVRHKRERLRRLERVLHRQPCIHPSS
jgi:transposase